MIEKRWKYVVLPLVVVMVLAMSVSCGQQAAEPTDAPAPPPEPTEAPTAAPVESTEVAEVKPEKIHILSYMTEPARIEWQEKVAEEWAKVEPDVELYWENIGWETLFDKHLAYETAGEQIDLGSGWSGFTYDFYNMGIIEPVSNYIPDWNDRFADFLSEKGADVIDGEFWAALPMQLNIYGIFGREDLIKQAGYECSDITSHEKLVEVALAVAEIHDGVAWGLPYGNARNAAGQGEGIWMSNGLWNLADFRDESRDAYIENLWLLQEAGATLPEAAFGWDAGGFRRGFAQGTSALTPIGQYFIPEGLNDMAPEMVDDEKICFFGYPPGPHTLGEPDQRVMAFDTNALYLMKNTPPESKAMTVKFLKWLVDDTNLMEYSDGYPALKDVDFDNWLANGGTAGGYKPFFIEQLNEEIDGAFFTEHRAFPARSEVHEAFYLHVLPLVKGEASPEETYELLKESIVPLILEAEPDYYETGG